MVVVVVRGRDAALSLDVSVESQRNSWPAIVFVVVVLVVVVGLGVVVGCLGGGFACASHSVGFRFGFGVIIVVGGVVVGGEVVIVVVVVVVGGGGVLGVVVVVRFLAVVVEGVASTEPSHAD